MYVKWIYFQLLFFAQVEIIVEIVKLFLSFEKYNFRNSFNTFSKIIIVWKVLIELKIASIVWL